MRESLKDARLNLTEKFYSLVEDLYRRASEGQSKVSKSHARKTSRAGERSPRSFNLRKTLSTRA